MQSSPILVPLVLIIVGISLFFIEAVVPSMGIITVLGAVMVTVSVVLFFNVSALHGIIVLVCTLLAAPLAVMFFFYVARNTGMVLSAGQEGYSASESRQHLLGKTGVASTYLRPSGVALIDGRRVDVTAEGDLIPEGTRIEVVKVDGIKVVVREVKVG